MFFVLSKVFWFFLHPVNLVAFFLLAGTLLLWTPWKRCARWLLTIASIFVLLTAAIPIGNQFRLFLENRFPVPTELPDKVDGIVVLGGAVDQYVSAARGEVSVGGSVERIFRFAALAQTYPEAKLVYSSGSGLITRQELKEADAVAPLLKQLGLDTERVMLENQSRNTHENAVLTFDMVSPTPDQTWILVTSATHMPRAMGCFRQAGWSNLIAYPADFKFEGHESFAPPLYPSKGLGGLGGALHELLGLTFYYLTGKTDALIPAP